MAKKEVKKPGKLLKLKPLKKKVSKKAVARISNDEAVFRDQMEAHFGISDVEYLAPLFKAVLNFTGTVAELNRVHGFEILDVVSFKRNSQEENGDGN